MSFSTDTQRAGVELNELFSEATRTGAGGIFATSCVTDWRQVQPGDVYVALPDGCGLDDADDGHQHAVRAVSCGAIAVVCEQPVAVFDVPTYLVRDSRIALGQLCQALVEYPTKTMPTIGVTGTHGKSTIIALVDAIFAAASYECGVLSSLTGYDGMSHCPGISDVPSAPTWASRLANMSAAPCSHAVIELSSRSLSQHTAAGIELDAVCVSNVTAAHLDRHNSVQSYRDIKRRVLDMLSPTGVTILNADDPVCMQWIDRVPGPALTYGLGGQAEVRGQILEIYSNEQTFVLTAGSESIAVCTKIVGEHHVSNCLAAATVALSYGIDLQTIAKGLEAVSELPGRMERVDCGQGFPVFVDAAETPAALSSVLRTARNITHERVICVMGDCQSESSSQQYTLNQIVQQMADLVVATSPLEESIGEEGAIVEVAPDRSTAIAWAVAMAEPGDVVVIVGSQSSPSRSFGQSSAPTDVEITRELLRQRNRPVLGVVA